MPKTMTFSSPVTKQPASTLVRIPVFLLYFAKDISVSTDKTGRMPFSLWHLQCLGSPMTCGNVYFKHFAKFLTFFNTQCWQTWGRETKIAHLPDLAHYYAFSLFRFLSNSSRKSERQNCSTQANAGKKELLSTCI